MSATSTTNPSRIVTLGVNDKALAHPIIADWLKNNTTLTNLGITVDRPHRLTSQLLGNGGNFKCTNTAKTLVVACSQKFYGTERDQITADIVRRLPRFRYGVLRLAKGEADAILTIQALMKCVDTFIYENRYYMNASRMTKREQMGNVECLKTVLETFRNNHLYEGKKTLVLSLEVVCPYNINPDSKVLMDKFIQEMNVLLDDDMQQLVIKSMSIRYNLRFVFDDFERPPVLVDHPMNTALKEILRPFEYYTGWETERRLLHWMQPDDE